MLAFHLYVEAQAEFVAELASMVRCVRPEMHTHNTEFFMPF